MTVEQLVGYILTIAGLGFGILMQWFIITMLSRAFHPVWSKAEMVRRVLRKEFGIKSRVVSVDATNIIRLVVLDQFPVAERLDDIKRVLTLDVRLEADDKQRPVLAVLPSDKGIRKPTPKAAQSRFARQMTPA